MLCAITTNTIGVQVKFKIKMTDIIRFARTEPSKIIRNAIDVQVKIKLR